MSTIFASKTTNGTDFFYKLKKKFMIVILY